MKNIKNTSRFILIALVALFVTSCNIKNDDPLVPADNSLTGIISRNPDLSTFYEAVKIAGLDTPTFLGRTATTLTVFAPNNAAFTTFLSANGYANLSAVPVATLTNLLKNHMVTSSIVTSSAGLSTLGADPVVSTFSGYAQTLAESSSSTVKTITMFINNGVYTAPNTNPSTTGIFQINGVSQVITSDITASNGVVHIINKIIPIPTLIDLISNNPNLSSLTTAVSAPAQATVLTKLTSATSSLPLTVFAPDNAAFSLLTATTGTGFGIGGSTLVLSNPTNISEILNYHLVSGNLNGAPYSLTNTDITVASPGAKTLTTLQSPKVLTVKFTLRVEAVPAIPATLTSPIIPAVPAITRKHLITDQTTGTARIARISNYDIQASNGVVHIVDRVMLPR